MLAALQPSPLSISHPSSRDFTGNTTMPDPSLLTEDRFCPGCKKSVVDENGGVVVAFGQSFFHVDCFKCAKCGNQVTADTNLLLLSDGSPICANCSYSCNVCREPILDEAIMTGDDSYHAHCFKCKVCKNRIDELVFAKTSQGIYCMNCHNQRVARSRRHAQRQREKEKEREREKAASALVGANASSSARSRDEAAKTQTDKASTSQPQLPAHLHSPVGHQPSSESSGASSLAQRQSGSSPFSGASSGSSLPERGSISSVPGRRDSLRGRQEAITATKPSITATFKSPPTPISASKRPSTATSTDPLASVRLSTPDLSPLSNPQIQLANSPTSRVDSLAVPSVSDGSEGFLQPRKSFDGGIRHPDSQLRPSPSAYSLSTSSANGSSGLGIPSGDISRRDRRRSINPATVQSFGSNLQSPSGSEPSSFLSSPSSRDSPRPSSPFRDYFSPLQTTSPPAYTDNPELALSSRVGSSSPHPSTPLSARGSADYESQKGQSHYTSSNSYLAQRSQEPEQTPRAPSRSGSAFEWYPSRPGSRAEQSQRSATQGYASDHSRAATPPDAVRRSTEGRRPPSLKLPIGNTIRAQRSFDDRTRASPPPSLRPIRNSRSSSGTMGIELELPSRPSSIPTPTSPAHHVDVPHGIESGTDTDAESEENKVTKMSDNPQDLPPALPPKDHHPARHFTRPPALRLDTADISRDASDAGHLGSEEGVSGSPESSPVERTSHATFIAPALPPIRISMGGTDFSELLRSVGGNIPKLEQLAETTEEGGRMLDLRLASSNSIIVNRRDSVQLLTPRSDITVTDSSELHIDSTPVKRSDYSLGGSSDVFTDSPSFASTLNADMLAKFPSVPDTRTSLDSSTQPHRVLGSNGTHTHSPVSSLSETRQEPLDALLESGRTHITVTSADNTSPEPLRVDLSDSLARQLQNIVSNAAERGMANVVLELDLAQTLLRLLAEEKEASNDLKRRLDGIKRASQQYMAGLTVAQEEYDQELKARRDAEAEVTRLRVLLSGQAVRLSAISADSKRQEAQKQLSEELSNNLSSLGRSISKLKVERDMTLAEVEQLSASKTSPAVVASEDGAVALTRALSMRFDNIKNQYTHELVPLTEQREALMREITELKASRDAFLEETTVLNARNEELAQLNAQYLRRLEAAGPDSTNTKQDSSSQEGSDMTHDRFRHIQDLSSSVTSSTVAFTEESAESKFVKVSKPEPIDGPTPLVKPGKFKWPGHKTPKENAVMLWPDTARSKGRKEHVFQQISVLRVARCDHCGDKMWGSQLRCTNCSVAVHIRCVHHVQTSCSQQMPSREETSQALAPLPPSMFGRDLVEQVRAESIGEPRLIPIIVEKCIEAVDALALDSEGIYRKTGGSSQVKTITQLFERGDYRTFDLRDTDRFNDICSVTSVLKSYLRALPDPLLTYALHAKFTAAAGIRDPAAKSKALSETVNELPKEHYYTTRALMLHLHRVSQHSDVNRMNARNLGVVFGPTLMRSRNFMNDIGDMAGSTLCMEWLVENAPLVFEHPPSFS